MSEQQETRQSSAPQAANQGCMCREIVDHLRDCLGVSPAVREHLHNSRIEFLKAIREVIDERIDRLSTKGQHGTKIAVE